MSDDYVSLEHREAQVAELEAEIKRLRTNYAFADAEIKRLRTNYAFADAEIERLKAALRRINNCRAKHKYDAMAMRDIARAALEGE